MCKLNILVLVLTSLGLLGLCNSTILQPGQCNTISVDSEFNITEFAGLWVETRRTGTVVQGSDCSTVEVNETETGISFRNTAVDNNFLVVTEGNGTEVNGTITLNINGVTDSFEVRALLVSYNTYALMYNCENVGADNRQLTVYLLQREGSQLTEMMTELIIFTLNSNMGLSLDDLRLVDHSEEACYQLPVILPGQPVILDGLCDPSIPAVPGFQTADFIGVWHEIGSYYSESSVGTCSRAEYSLGDGALNVVNSEVVNETLSTVTGNASVISADGSGRLRVVLEIAPGVAAEQELLIIGTDYISFAVSYSCVNLTDTNQRRVFSWILSRAPQLTSVTQNLIDETLHSQMDLNQRYYRNTPRSDEDCFYFPDANGQPVIFRGQCDQTIPVMANFNASDYLGTWHSIESYPSQFVFGSCVNAIYSLRDDGDMNVINTQVFGERLLTIEGVAVVANASEPAKLRVTFPIEGTNLTTTSDYWVLDTDYSTYSLVYTCVDLENNERAVTSWKLSRTKSLNSTVLTIMDEIIDTIPVLNNSYYQQEDQTVPGCFYYPDPVPGQIVIFPGQCEDIATVDNFNLTAFAGTWIEMAAYPNDQQDGQCISHEYEVTGDNTLSIQSSEIVNQFLEITNGNVTSEGVNSARLTVNITTDDGNVISFPFWIVDTDYENYALAYSCVNRGNDMRAVYGWKLSRTYNLSNESNDAIDDAMAPINVLNNTYFEPVDQSLDACFYLPDLAPGEPVILVGQCDPDIPIILNFQPDLYTGTWRLLSSYPAEFQDGTCQDATYSLLDNGTVEVYNTQVVNETLDTITGSAVLASENGTGLLLVSFPGSPEQSEYWIIDTDYTSYSLVYSCVNINDRERRIYSWILSRNETLPDESLDIINGYINDITVLNNRFYQLVSRTDDACFYYPEPNDDPVVFRGQCNQNITVVQNFNATAYLGLWHSIESYPTVSQLGTCNNAYYSAGDDGVINVLSTEVRNQTLSSVDGIAYVSDDDPAKLIVSFPSVNNETIDYWILDTDYSSYSLVYSCVNLDEEHRRVWSWKLGRVKELTEPAELAINETIRNIQVLDDRYYLKEDQSPEGCFFYPDAIEGVPVIFPGQCDNNISVIANFNITRFEGRWHEIESYPVGEQRHCLSHTVSPGTVNTWNVVSNSVSNLSLSTSGADLSVSSTAEPGRLTITFTTASGVVTQPLWILDTDYDNYALAYSCVDNDDDTRNVYSWKLSRRRELSSEFGDTINNIIDTVDVLRDDYYWPVNQTDDSCFFLPDLQPGELAIFPGQCDLNIPVVANFDMNRYLGRWRLISSYPTYFQEGTCNEVYYGLEEGFITVYNSEVIDQTLASFNGTAQVIENGKLQVHFPAAPEPIEFWILDTDYDTYSLVYSCLNINDEQRLVWSWKMSRGHSLNETVLQTMDEIIDGINVLNDIYYYDIARSEDDCFYFPEPNDEPVVFRGQCNESISVVQEFNVTAYSGHWYAIESYPQEFQFGTCQRALYTVNDDGSVEVYNTQVYQQRLDAINGTAVLASSDGSAKLNVTFLIAEGFEVTSPYWVLDTDYDNYALVYSCVNIDEDYYRVSSWKLSRDSSINSNINATINSVMSDIRVLDQSYFITWGHSEEECFFYPPLTDGRVVLDGQCEDDIVNVVENFNATGFAGAWYEIERFPSELQSGECTANNFELTSANTFTLSKTFTYNERLETLTGTAIVAEGGNGVLSVNLNSEDGSSINLDLYVLDTDYDTYALLYSCRNYDDNRKQVFSWKLSKYQEGLTDEANANIDQIVNNTTDLFEDYYDVIGQNNDACFYYPEFDELPPIIELPGPCDESIVGVPNFDMENYIRLRWFEIYRYPQSDQSGLCSRVEYTVNGDSIGILNTEVVNLTLISEEGTMQLASNDGSGVINVTYVVNNEIKVDTLYVLATDYGTYSLVYNCENLDNGNRIVRSWKLSRGRTLLPASEEAIDRVVENIQGLNNDYYIETDQSEDACFYVPEVKDETPLFRHRCEDITGQQGFDIQRFLGWWHQIEGYPQDEPAGDCVSSDYHIFGNNQIRVVDTGIFNVTAQQDSGIVQADSNGRLIRYINGIQDIWVLATDYETYAILYSCSTGYGNNMEYSRVWSAKYSKSRITEFPEAAQAVMDNVIAANKFLYPQFYLPVDQSDSACFHYPEKTRGQVILPGQCDENIPVEQNFKPVEYTGTWYEIERYVEQDERSQCAGTRYTLDGDSEEFTVLNWDVITYTLQTIEGTAVVSSDDGSGKLVVSMPINGTEVMTNTSLYVLATDYVSYSLVYSCENVDDYYRAVTAWKLSRTRSLPAASAAAIDSYMASREELHQPYFIQVVQNDTCQEPNSSVFIRSSIIVMLACLVVKMFV
ncbi:uncharacterized protein LOC106136222 [Amyelois transitella]|uniref:uncharacterized protein LOC106136222 n=1 Tax=Amyelois transitella TaxID=680683 RepID=UPI00299049A7|nr:uncharacterized protein LOC106136222 [Amyelois transitella]